MLNYKTAQEKAVEWNVSPRHVQNLCKKGEIKGAVKKAGAWFIPDNVPIPTKNTKANTKRFYFVGTRKKIFECAIKLFMLKGYEAVSVRDIANAVGVTQSSLYNHFKSKQEILDTIYGYFCYYYHKDRPSLESIVPILRDGSLMDIMTSVLYKFDPEYMSNLLDITKIIVQRNAIDKRAGEITKTVIMDSGSQFVEEVFNKAIEIGRIAPIDTSAMSFFINSIRTYTLHLWLLDSAQELNEEKINRDEMEIYKYATKLLVDLKPPGKNG